MAISSKEWLSFLVNENGASFYVDSMGVVKTSLIPKPLKNMFDGWADMSMTYGRSAEYFGLERTYTSSYKFVKHAATILRSLLYGTRSLESKVYLVMSKWNESNGLYETYYKAEVDLSTAADDPRQGITCEVIQDGPAKNIKTNDSILYEFPCEGITLDLDGVLYSDTMHFFCAGLGPVDSNTQWIAPLSFVNSDGYTINVIKGNQYSEQIYGDIATNLRASGNYALSTSQTMSVLIEGTFTIVVEDSIAGFDLSFYVFDQTAPIVDYKFTVIENGLASPGTYSVNFSQSIPISKNAKMFLFLNVPTIAFAPKVTLLETKCTMKMDTRFQKTQCAAIRPFEAATKLVQLMTDNRYAFSSSLLQANEHLVMTCGDAIRGLSSPKIKTTFKDLFSSYSKILNGALGVNYNTQEIVFETKEYFFNDTELIDLGEVSELSIELDRDSIFNSIKCGYPNQKNEEAIAKQETNSTQVYKTPITRLKKELDLVIPYRTDIFGIERVRIEYNNKPDTNSKADNSVFIINIERTINPDSRWDVYRPTYSFTSGGTNISSWYNMEQLSPKTVLKANGNLISGGLYALSNDLVTFVSGESNTDLIRTLSGVTTVENGSLRVSSLNPSYYRPFLIKGKAITDQNIVAILQEAGRGYVTGTWKGVRFKGYAKEITVRPVFDEPIDFVLQCSSLTDPAIFSNINDDAIIIEDMGIISHKLPVKFVRVDANYLAQHHFKQMDTDFFGNRIDAYSQQENYFQKWQTNDSFDIQFITNGLAATLTIVDNNNTLVDTITLSEPTSPTLIPPKQLYTGTIDCSALTAGKTYYLLATFGTDPGAKQFVSEPILVSEDWPGTLLIEYQNDANQTDMIWNNPTFTGKIRVEGFIQGFRPGGRLTQYEDQPMDIVSLDRQPTRGYQLLLGSNFGIPDWMIDKLNRILTLDHLTIDGFAYSLDKDAKLEAIETMGAPMGYWTIAIREENNKAGIAIDATGENDSELTIEYDINTKGFSSNASPANQQDTIIQITEIE
jgi:hypothetical protein